MTQMRTISQAVDHIHRIDPESGLTKHAVRQLVKRDIIPSIRVGAKGTKYLVNLEVLENYLNKN